MRGRGRGRRGRIHRVGDDIHFQCKRQRAYAWAQYYEEKEERADNAMMIVRHAGIQMNRNGEVTTKSELPPHITNEFYEMAVALRKEFNCPVCFEMVDSKTIVVTICGHIYCKECLQALKQRPEPTCAMCRFKLT